MELYRNHHHKTGMGFDLLHLLHSEVDRRALHDGAGGGGNGQWFGPGGGAGDEDVAGAGAAGYEAQGGKEESEESEAFDGLRSGWGVAAAEGEEGSEGE
jgi:hypothetical protein